jgi:hypothetical protein
MVTFVTVDVGILDNYGPAVECVILLGLVLRLANVSSIFGRASRRYASRYTDNMAGEKFFRDGKVGIGRSRLAVAALEQRFCCRNQEDMVVDGKTLRGEGASEEGPQEGV